MKGKNVKKQKYIKEAAKLRKKLNKILGHSADTIVEQVQRLSACSLFKDYML
jgi:hypothetical protein